MRTRVVPAIRTAAVTLLAGAALLIGACGGPDAPAAPTPAPPPVATPTPPPVADARLAVPPGRQLVLTMPVQRGSQVYVCTGGAWGLRGPVAVLTSPGTDALHDAGPRWTATVDGSSVVAAQVTAVDVPEAIPHLLLRTTERRGGGVLGGVEYIQRLATSGGRAPAGPCTDGQERAVAYGAEYRFWAPGTS